MKITAIATKRGFYPANKIDEKTYIEFCNKQKGKPCLIQISNPRNLKQHNLFFALLNMVVLNTDKWHSVEHLRRALLYKLGLFSFELGFDDKMIPVVDSMKFMSMDQKKFDEQVFQPSLPFLADEMGIGREDFKINYMKYLSENEVNI